MATVTRRLAALLGASGAGLTDSATASKITTDSINDDAVNAAKIAANAVGTSEVADNVLTATDLAANSVGESELSVDYTAQSVPHIIPGVLYPAYTASGTTTKLLDGITNHGSNGNTAYGTLQADGRKYYYTNIAGSKPIKDPRIGAHFGSQRHKFKSIQKLEQETATHGNDVFSVDGREWIRMFGGFPSLQYSGNGNYINCANTGSNKVNIEIVGYFSSVNVIAQGQAGNVRRFVPYIDGGSAGTNTTQPSVSSPLDGRFVDSGMVQSLTFNSALTTPGIHTLKLINDTNDIGIYAVELIAQDTTSTANRSKIKFPVQNVVSFGKKFEITETNHHYDPFSAKTDGSAWTSPTSGTNNANSSASWPTNIDTATSLGLDKWVDGSNYYRPYNGGRVVKWVDSDGTIKTSVTIMPPNAKSFKNDNVNKKEKNAGNTTYLPTFEAHTTDIHEDQLHEVAKTFNYREFGNGAANEGNTTSGSHQDFSMLAANDNVSYVMDDGLTSLSAYRQEVAGSGGLNAYGMVFGYGDSNTYQTFIGTGFQFRAKTSTGDAQNAIAQNLPYGTHVFYQLGTGSSFPISINGQSLGNFTSLSGNLNYAIYEITIYQPKRPPIPEDCVVLADYMLMADFVPATSVNGSISKGVRYCNASRDVFYDSAATITYNAGYQSLGYQFVSMYNNNANNEARITAFGSAYESHYVRGTNRVSNTQARLDGSNYSYVEADVYDTGGEWDDSEDNGTLTKVGSEAFHMFGIKNQTLGVHTFGDKNSSGSDYNAWSAFAVATPIHTSHHYKSFETPFLHELIGGDRNMEQTNLVCTPDGKTWDQLTRDTSYIGSACVSAGGGPDNNSSSGAVVLTEWRGKLTPTSAVKDLFNKNWAIAYDRLICLKTGYYLIHYTIKDTNNSSETYIYRNSGSIGSHPTVNGAVNMAGAHYFSRGDYLRLEGVWDDDDFYNYFQITELK